MSSRLRLQKSVHVVRFALIVALAAIALACSPIPRWSYLAVTRVDVMSDSGTFSTQEIERAELVAAGVAREIGMKPNAATDEEIRLERMITARQKPARRFLNVYAGTMSSGLPIELRLEVGEGERSLYFSVSDYERGTASPTVTRVRNLMMTRVEAAFPDAAIVHEAQSLGPFFDLHP